MVSLWDNKKLRYVLICSWCLLLLAATDGFAPLNDALDLVPMPDSSLRNFVLLSMILNTAAVMGLEALIRHFFGFESPRVTL